MSAALAAWIVIGAGIAACLGTRALIPVLRRASVLDRPNERSSHEIPTPRGGGLAVIAAVLAAWLVPVAAGTAPPSLLAVIAAAAVLAAISWLDDLRGLSPSVRLGVQAAAVALGLILALPDGAVFQGWLPDWLDRAAAALLWIWFVNLYNFMDGIDGIAGSETAAIGVGLALFAVTGIAPDPAPAALPAALPAILPGTIAAAAIGFLVWNWAPARIFLGDVGSVPLGYLLGFLLLAAASRGQWKIALILPLYFLADATITLLRRLLRGERVWLPHREHFYQQAVRRGLGHAAVVRRVIAADAVLIVCAWLAETVSGALGLAVAVATVLVLLAGLAGGDRRSYTAPDPAKGGQE